LRNLILLLFISLLCGCKTNLYKYTQQGIKYDIKPFISRELVFLHPDIVFYKDDDFIIVDVEKTFAANTTFITLFEKQINANNLNSQVVSAINTKENSEFSFLYKTKQKISSSITSQYSSLAQNPSKSHTIKSYNPCFYPVEHLKNFNLFPNKNIVLYDIKIAPNKTLTSLKLLNTATGKVEFIQEKLYLGSYKPQYLELIIFESLDKIKIKAKS